MVIFSPVESSVDESVQDLIDDHYPDIADAGLTIHCMLAWSEDGNPVKHNGHPADATIEKNNPKDRAQGKKDCTITIDKSRWEEKSDRQRTALLDHELRHIEILRITKGEDAGEIKIDSVGRPCIGLHPHDLVVGGFRDIAERYGDDSPEVEAIKEVYRQYRRVAKKADAAD